MPPLYTAQLYVDETLGVYVVEIAKLLRANPWQVRGFTTIGKVIEASDLVRPPLNFVSFFLDWIEDAGLLGHSLSRNLALRAAGALFLSQDINQYVQSLDDKYNFVKENCLYVYNLFELVDRLRDKFFVSGTTILKPLPAPVLHKFTKRCK